MSIQITYFEQIQRNEHDQKSMQYIYTAELHEKGFKFLIELNTPSKFTTDIIQCQTKGEKPVLTNNTHFE